MKKTSIISILIIFLIIWNVIFPCISHAQDTNGSNNVSIENIISQYGEIDTIEKVLYVYEQVIIQIGETQKEYFLAQRCR